jgi:prephenate dehydrogenase
MQQPPSIAIVGTGLIGASIGLALHRLPKPPTFVGFDTSQETLRIAQRSHAVDRAAASLREAVDRAELVVIATPVRAVEAILREVGNLLYEGTVVTDTASTKEQVIEWASRLLPKRVSFVGGHPMTGKMSAQVDGASATLFDGATYCLTPEVSTPPESVERVVRLVESVGSKPYFLQPAEHDAIMAAISHLPYLLSAALMEDVGGSGSWREMSHLAAGGLLAATSLAEGDPFV